MLFAKLVKRNSVYKNSESLHRTIHIHPMPLHPLHPLHHSTSYEWTRRPIMDTANKLRHVPKRLIKQEHIVGRAQLSTPFAPMHNVLAVSQRCWWKHRRPGR